MHKKKFFLSEDETFQMKWNIFSWLLRATSYLFILLNFFLLKPLIKTFFLAYEWSFKLQMVMVPKGNKLSTLMRMIFRVKKLKI